MVSQVSRATWESKETGARLVCSGPVERMGLRAPKAELVPAASQVPSDMLERKVNWASQDCQDTRGDKDRRAPAGSQGFPEPTERKEPEALQANRVPEDREVRRVLVELVGPEVQQENQGQRAHQETTVPRARLEREDHKDLRGQWASPDRRALLAQLERMGCLDIPASVARQVSKEKLDHQAQEVLSVPRDPLEKLVPLVREATLDPLVHPENRGFQGLLARRERRETLDHRGPRAKMDPPACEAFLEREVYLAPRVLQV